MPLSAHLPALILLLACATASLAAAEAAGSAAGPVATILTSSGGSGSGALHLAAGSSVTVGSVTTTQDGLIDLEVEGGASGSTRLIDQGVILADGEVLRGVPRRLEAGKLSFLGDTVGEVEFDAEKVAVVALGSFPINLAAKLATSVPGAYFPNGESLAGTPDYINQREVGMTQGGRVRRYPRERVQLVVLRPATNVSGTWIQLTSGDCLGGIAGGSSDAGVQLETSFGKLTVPLSGLAGMWSVSPALQPLDALPCQEQDAPAIEAVAPATLGGIAPSTLLGQGERHGILQAASSTLLFQDPGPWSALVGRVRAVYGDGLATCTIVMDGKMLWRSAPLKAGSSFECYHVQVSGAHSKLQLSVHAAGDVPVTVLWSIPTLVK